MPSKYNTSAQWIAIRMNSNSSSTFSNRATDAATVAHKQQAACSDKSNSNNNSATSTQSPASPSPSVSAAAAAAAAAQRAAQSRPRLCSDNVDALMHHNNAPLTRRTASEPGTFAVERSSSNTSTHRNNNNNATAAAAAAAAAATSTMATTMSLASGHGRNHYTAASSSISSSNSTSTQSSVARDGQRLHHRRHHHHSNNSNTHSHHHHQQQQQQQQQQPQQQLHGNNATMRGHVVTDTTDERHGVILTATTPVTTTATMAPDKLRGDRSNGSLATPPFLGRHQTTCERMDKRNVLLPGSVLSHNEDNKAVLPRAAWLSSSSNNNTTNVSAGNSERPATSSNASVFFSFFSTASATPSLQDLACMPHAQLSEDNVYKLSMAAHKAKAAAAAAAAAANAKASTQGGKRATTQPSRRTSHESTDDAEDTARTLASTATTTMPLCTSGATGVAKNTTTTTTTTTRTAVAATATANDDDDDDDTTALIACDTHALDTPEPSPHTDLLRLQSTTVYAGSVRSIATPTTTQRVCSVVKRKDSNGSKHLNQYLILRELGRGECGKVKLAYDEAAQRLVAIKQVRRADTQRQRVGGMTAAQRTYMAFLREVNIMQNLHHHNIAPVYEIIDDPTADKVYLVMKYIEKGPIAHIEVKAGTEVVCTAIAPDELARLALQILTGLEYLHRHNIVHRDIKPDNILRDGDGQVFLVDFGVAETFDTTYRARMESRKTQSMARSMALSVAGECASGPVVLGVKGTLLFIAPELWTRQRSYGKPVDVWAVGVTLFTLLTGRLPFRNLNEVSDATLPVIPATYSAAWQELLHGMFERDPARRLTVQQARALVKARLLAGDANNHPSADSSSGGGSSATAARTAAVADEVAASARVDADEAADTSGGGAMAAAAAAAAATAAAAGNTSARRAGVVYGDFAPALMHERRAVSPLPSTAPTTTAASPTAGDALLNDSGRMLWLLDAPFSSAWSLNSLCSNVINGNASATSAEAREWRVSTAAASGSNTVTVALAGAAAAAAAAASGSRSVASSAAVAAGSAGSAAAAVAASGNGRDSETSIPASNNSISVSSSTTHHNSNSTREQHAALSAIDVSSVVSQLALPVNDAPRRTNRDALPAVLPARRQTTTRAATAQQQQQQQQQQRAFMTDAAASRSTAVALAGEATVSPVMATMSRKSSGRHATFAPPHGDTSAVARTSPTSPTVATMAQATPHHSTTPTALHSLLLPPTLQRRSAKPSAYSLRSLSSCSRSTRASALRFPQHQMSATQTPQTSRAVMQQQQQEQQPPPLLQLTRCAYDESDRDDSVQLATATPAAALRATNTQSDDDDDDDRSQSNNHRNNDNDNDDDDDDGVQIQQMQLARVNFDTSVGDDVDRFMVSAYTTSSQAAYSNSSTVNVNVADGDSSGDERSSSCSSMSSSARGGVVMTRQKSLQSLSMPSL